MLILMKNTSKMYPIYFHRNEFGLKIKTCIENEAAHCGNIREGVDQGLERIRRLTNKKKPSVLQH